MRSEFFTPQDRLFTALEDLQAALDGWVAEYNTARPHQSCGGRPPAERFALADRPLAADTTVAAEPPRPPARPAGERPAGVSRWVDAAGKISLGGFSYSVGATYAGEPVEVVVAVALDGALAMRIGGLPPRALPRIRVRPKSVSVPRPKPLLVILLSAWSRR